MRAYLCDLVDADSTGGASFEVLGFGSTIRAGVNVFFYDVVAIRTNELIFPYLDDGLLLVFILGFDLFFEFGFFIYLRDFFFLEFGLFLVVTALVNSFLPLTPSGSCSVSFTS